MNTKARADFRGILAGWVNQPDVTIIVAFVAELSMFLVIAKALLPVDRHLGVVGLGIVGLSFVGTVFVAMRRVWGADTTENVRVEHQSGWLVSTQSPSMAVIALLIQQVVSRIPKPDLLIPPEVDPKAEPSKFRKPTPEDVQKLIETEVNAALQPSGARPTEATTDSSAEATATIVAPDVEQQ